jgi:hypothetical protein
MRFVIVYFTNFDIQWPFSTALEADKKPCRMHPSFHLFSAKYTAAVNANVDVNKRVRRIC